MNHVLYAIFFLLNLFFVFFFVYPISCVFVEDTIKIHLNKINTNDFLKVCCGDFCSFFEYDIDKKTYLIFKSDFDLYKCDYVVELYTSTNNIFHLEHLLFLNNKKIIEVLDPYKNEKKKINLWTPSFEVLENKREQQHFYQPLGYNEKQKKKNNSNNVGINDNTTINNYIDNSELRMLNKFLKNKDIHKNVNKDIHKNVNKDIHKNVNKDIHKNVNKDIHNNVNKDIQKNVNKDIHKNVNTKMNKKMNKEINKKINKEINKTHYEYVNNKVNKQLLEKYTNQTNTNGIYPNSYTMNNSKKVNNNSYKNNIQIIDDFFLEKKNKLNESPKKDFEKNKNYVHKQDDTTIDKHPFYQVQNEPSDITIKNRNLFYQIYYMMYNFINKKNYIINRTFISSNEADHFLYNQTKNTNLNKYDNRNNYILFIIYKTFENKATVLVTFLTLLVVFIFLFKKKEGKQSVTLKQPIQNLAEPNLQKYEKTPAEIHVQYMNKVQTNFGSKIKNITDNDLINLMANNNAETIVICQP
ncbi:conserved membrane protein, unknown function [Hepatocystis sp. ex Piliocolobus tephrosceles]|nr:conserved membrane protein, unknown function [Hepatocystis sp. ex Piliocolobus tephrosceles]